MREERGMEKQRVEIDESGGRGWRGWSSEVMGAAWCGSGVEWREGKEEVGW